MHLALSVSKPRLLLVFFASQIDKDVSFAHSYLSLCNAIYVNCLILFKSIVSIHRKHDLFHVSTSSSHIHLNVN